MALTGVFQVKSNNSSQSDSFGLQVEDRPMYATKALLAARSEHFRALFYGGMRESQQSGDDGIEIEIPDIAYDVFLALLQYIYTDRVRLMMF